MIGGWTLDRYERLLSPQLILSPLFLVTALLRWSNVVIVLIEVAWFIALGLIISRRRGGVTETLVAGATAGLFSGLAVSLGRWLAEPSAEWGANVVAETLVSAVIGALIATSTEIIDRRWRTSTKP